MSRPFYFHEQHHLGNQIHSASEGHVHDSTVWDSSPTNLFNASFLSQIREYSHQSIIVNINIVQYYRMVDFAKFLDEFLHSMFFSLIFPV